SAKDLLGKKVTMNTLGAHSEFMLKEYLLRSQLTRQDARSVTLVAVPPVNGEQILRERPGDVAALGDLFRDRALERGGIRTLFSDYELYGAFTAGSYVMRRKFIDQHPKAARHFVEAVARALKWSRETPRDEVVERFRQMMAKRGRNENPDILRYWKS